MLQTKYAVMLSEEDRANPRPLIGQGTASARLLTHARILIKADQSEDGPAWSDAGIAAFAHAHADQIQRNYAALAAALTNGKITAVTSNGH